jgi:hypothetical protein
MNCNVGVPLTTFGSHQKKRGDGETRGVLSFAGRFRHPMNAARVFAKGFWKVRSLFWIMEVW